MFTGCFGSRHRDSPCVRIELSKDDHSIVDKAIRIAEDIVEAAEYDSRNIMSECYKKETALLRKIAVLEAQQEQVNRSIHAAMDHRRRIRLRASLEYKLHKRRLADIKAAKK